MAIGTWGAVGGVAAAAGPSIGSLVVDAGGWRWGFWLSVPLARKKSSRSSERSDDGR